ncbi:DivIVA domain-containing protein [Caryophanon tenue]|uniref:Septum formation initiator n=1 Tax=Caryophanon tenue TaxID=33978 RepID=A0A1C0YK98_9BACL|nr:DivIVA domain-containing protein [Caryophanon tenue]OCS87598.1 septum formation initiator [Caryophanon tenue]
MPLSPLDIHNKEFTKAFRGYSEDEVNDFLDQVIKDYEILIKEKLELEERLKKAEATIQNYEKMEETLQSAILLAQETAEETRSSAHNEAKLIVKEAEKNADRIVSDALQKARKATADMDDLKKQSIVFRRRLQILVETQLEMLKQGEWEQHLDLNADVAEVMNVDILEEKPNE